MQHLKKHEGKCSWEQCFLLDVCCLDLTFFFREKTEKWVGIQH